MAIPNGALRVHNSHIRLAKKVRNMNGKVVKTVTVVPLLSLALAASANDFDHVWSCELNAGKTLDEARAVSAEWLRAARSMEGGEQLQVYVNYPIVVGASAERFDFVVRAPSLEVWGRFYDRYHADSPVAKVDAGFAAIATCSGSSLWESIRIE